MKKILFLLLLIPVFAGAQNRVYVTQDQPQQIRQFRGGVDALNYFRFPIQGGHSIPAGDSLWFVRVNPGDGQIYMYNGLTWSCMTCGGAGIVDSSVFVTVTRLIDSLSRVQQTLDDSTAALRLLIASGSADSALFATLYRLDSTRAGLDMRIALKQNQLSGTGFVKASGTTISYDNSTYTPTGRTITINGISQDLSANRSWTISSSADSSIFATKYGVDTAKAALRSSINSKQNLITLTTTGTSGAATFNQSTGALNIPNYANTTYTGSTSIVLTSGSFQRAALTGDVTATQNSNSTTISNSAVTNAKMANMATQTFKGRNTAGSGAPEDIGVSTARTMLSINNVDNTSDLNKPISTATQAALNLKVDSIRTSVDSIYVKANGTWYFAGVVSAQGAGVSWGSIGGTLSSQTDLQNALNAKLNTSDTSTMLAAYLRKVDTVSLSNRINTKMGYSDTVSLSNRINAKLSISDTSAMLGSYLRKVDTASLSNRINLKLNIADTANMLGVYLRKADTVTLSNRINLKVNISDTSAMLSPYLRKSDTANMLNSYARQSALDDSMDIVRDSINALRADIGSGGLDTTAGDARYLKLGGNVGNTIAGTTSNNDFTLIRNGQTRLLLPSTSNIVSLAAFNTTSATPSEVGYQFSARRDFRASDVAGTTSIGKSTNSGDKLEVLGASTFDGTSSSTGYMARFRNSSGTVVAQFNNNNTAVFSSLAGTGTRMVVADNTGELGTQAIPAGSVTSVGISVPTGFSVSSSPVTSSGTIAITYAAGYQGYTSTEASKLSGIEGGADVTDATNVAAAGAIMDGDFSSNGVMVRTAAGAYASRTITGTTNQITVTNGDGVSGNPTLSLDTTVIATKHYVDSSLNTPALVSINNQSGSSYTLTSNDFNGKTVVIAANSGSITIEVPPSMPVGSSVLIEQGGAGQITFTPGSGVTLHSFESALTTKGTNATVTIYCKAADTYTLTGNLE